MNDEANDSKLKENRPNEINTIDTSQTKKLEILEEKDESQKIIFRITIIYLIALAIIMILFWTVEKVRNRIIYFFIELQDGTFKGYAILFIIGLLIIITGGPIAIYEMIIGFLL